jgi:hypothetical protein
MRYFTYLCVLIYSVTIASAATINVSTPGSLNTLVTNPNMSNLTLTGSIDARDFKYIRDNMPNLVTLDITNTSITSYSGLGGTSSSATDIYPANTIPTYAFCDPNTHTGKITLSQVKLPTNITKIDKYSFKNCTQLTGVLNIPTTVTSISDEAFRDCKGFTGNLNIPLSVTTLGSNAFAGATGFSDIFIPSSTTSIGTYCFSDTPMKIHVDPANPSYRSKDSILYNKATTLLMSAPTSTTGKYIIPNTVTSIGSSAFQNCYLLTEVVLPPSLTTIGDAAFYHCTGLVQQLTIPATLKTIGANAFNGCEGLNGSLQLPSNSLTIGSSAFYGCKGFDGNLNLGDSLSVLGSSAFEGCSGFQGPLIVPSKIKTIDVSTFKNCSGFNSLSLPSSITAINVDAFNGCTGFMTIDNVSQVPIPISSSVFDKLDKNTCTLYVPLGKKDAYSNTPAWNQFKHIIDGFNFWISNNKVSMTKNAGSLASPIINVNSNTTWTASSTDSWIVVLPSSPVSGNGTISIRSLNANTTDSKRIGTVTVSAPGATSQTISVTQAIGYSTLSISHDSITVTREANSTATVEVTSNTDWTASSDQAWLTVNPSSFSENGILTFTATSENFSTLARHAIVTISANGIAPKTIVVTQSERITLYFTPSPILTNTKVYDKSTTANVILGTISGIVPAHPDVQVSITANYSDVHAGTNKKIYLQYKITGTDAIRYQLPNNYTALGEITPIQLIATAVTDTKTYDGSTNSKGVPLISGNLIGKDSLTASPTQNFEDKNTGNKQIFPDALKIEDGNNGLNYKITYMPANGTISKAYATVKAMPDNRVYNGSKSSTIIPQVFGLVNTDTVLTKPVQIFQSKHIGTSKRLMASGLIIADDNNGGNYIINYVDTLAGTISKATVSVIARPDTKIYDRNINSSLSPIVMGVASSDTISKQAFQEFENWNVGKNKTLISSGIVINDGNGGNNYNVNYINDYNGEIQSAVVQVLAQSDSKTYDKKTFSNKTPNVSGIIAPDVIQSTPIQLYENYNAGINKVLIPSGLVINDGNGGKNYIVKYQSDSTGEIKPSDIQVIALKDSRLYDGSTASSKNPSITGSIIVPDVISKNAIQNFDNRNSGTNKTLIPSGLIIDDNAGGNNYKITYINDTSGIITPYPLTITAQADSKSYDGTTQSKVVPLISGSITAPDSVAIRPIQTFETRKIGTNILLIPSGLVMEDGNQGKNYSFNYVPAYKGTITKATVLIVLTVQARADDKTYDGTDKASLKNATLSGVASGDDVQLDTVECKFNQNKVGKDLPVSIVLQLKGTDIDNYTLVQPSNLKANINSKTLNLDSLTVSDKIYDGTLNANLNTGKLNGIIGNDDVKLSNTYIANFAQAGVKSKIPVTYHLTLTGVDASNYLLSLPIGITGNITPKQLSATDPSYNYIKTYDGTKQASAKMGVLQGIVTQDFEAVSFNANTQYDTPLVGTNKTLTTSYTLTGTAAGNYINPPDHTSNQGVITPKQLIAVNSPIITKFKLYDGNTIAVVDSSCLISGMIMTDAGSISIKPQATYDNSNVGNNKTITVNYVLSGLSSANYLPPIPYTVNDGKILSQIKIDPELTSTIGCEDGYYNLQFKVISGEVTKYQIIYDTQSLSAGFKNDSIVSIPNNNTSLTIPVPAGVIYGTHKAKIQFRNDFGIVSPLYDFEVTINLSNALLVTKFGDIILCDNSSKLFTKYQWYKNNQLIQGATKQYYFDENGLSGEYYVKVSFADGKEMQTCPKSLNLSKIKKINTFPNPCKEKNSFTVQSTGFSDAEIKGAKLTILNVSGKEIDSLIIDSNEQIVDIDLQEGMYLGKLTTNNNRDYTFKIIITK